METTTDMKELSHKLDDLKSAFYLGQRLIPIIQSLVDFMKDTVPLLEQINNSITESTRRIPRVSSQISDITNATELATNEILDRVDKIVFQLDDIEKGFQYGKENSRKKILETQIMAMVGDQPVGGLLKDYFDISSNDIEFAPLSEKFNLIKEDAYKITLSLQVQDITAQQLSAVNHLIQSVQTKLTSLLVNFSASEMSTDELAGVYNTNDAFNPYAKYSPSSNHQEIADGVIFASTSQDEIDKLFG